MSFSFRQSPGEGWFRIGTVEVTTTVLVTGLSVVSLFIYAASPSFLAEFALSTAGFSAGKIWQLLTWPLVNTPDQTITLLISIFFYYIFSRDIEQSLGRRRYLIFTILLAIVPALIGVVFALIINSPFATFGLGLLAAGVVVAYVAIYPAARTFFDLPLWVLVIALLGIDALGYTGSRDWASLVFLALIAGTGLLLSRSFHMSRLTWIPTIPLPGSLTGERVPRSERKHKKQAKLKVVHTDDINTILEKIAATGMDSLTKDERKRLDDYSREARD